MSRRNKKQKARESNSQLLQRAERELAKGNAKTALKDAKVAFRNDPVPDARRLLETAYAGRVEQLHRQNLLSEAQAVLRDLLDFKPVDPNVCERLPLLQVLVGDKAADPAVVFARQPELLNELTDKAILDWKALAPEYADLPRQVAAVRDALTAIESGEDERATELLQEIPRTSPLGDWKLFARGLSAFYQQDKDRTAANWQRLDPARPANQIARTLQAAAGDMSEQAAADVERGVKRLNARLGSGQGFEQLASLSQSWRSGDWRTFCDELRRFRARHGTAHTATLQRIAELAWRRAVRESDYDFFARLKGCLPAPELDPKWSRAWALFSEHSRDGDVDAVEKAWKAYALDVRGVSCLRDDERPIAEGLVYLRLGTKFIEFAEYNASRMLARWAGDDEEDQLRKDAAGFLRQSIEACPRLEDAYRELAELHEESEDLDKAAAVYKKLLKQVPDDFDSHIWLARFYLEQEEPESAKVYTSGARRLKPRDPQCVALAWSQQLATVRHLAKKRKLDDARAELKKLHEIRPAEIDLSLLDVVAAAIEFKAKNPEAANKFVDDALARFEEPTAVWLQMSCAAARYSLPKEIKKQFDERFKEAIQQPPTSQTAGYLAKFFASLKSNQINYTGRATQERLALAYLARTTSIAWTESDLCQVCEFLFMCPRQHRLVEKLSEIGLALYPKSPRLLFCAGTAGTRLGPHCCDVDHVLKCLRSAIELNGQASLPMNSSQVESARESLSDLEDFAERKRNIGFGFRAYEDDADDELDGDDDDDFDDDDDMDLGGIDMLPPDIDVDKVIDTMPPELKKQMKQVAAMAGMSLKDVIMGTLSMGIAEELKKQSQPRGGGRTPQTNQTNFGFADDE
ncbi:MAG: tetratricopeptide repeat protein [Planctomycetota bacterium]|nr:tetratricopeptide repeat protein [Planctomycetota bacterium]